MQIDLANTLVHKVYSIHNDIIYHCPQALAPLLWRGWGRLSPPSGGVGGGLLGEGVGGRLSLKRGGHTDKRVNHKMDFDFEFD